MTGASFQDRASHERNPQAVSAVPVTIPSAFPLEESDPGASEWVAARLTERQRQVIQRMAGHKSEWHQASSLAVSASTLASLRDFRRGERGWLPPLSVVSQDFNPFTRCADWALTRFGRRVAQAIEARSGETGTGSTEGESASQRVRP